MESAQTSWNKVAIKGREQSRPFFLAARLAWLILSSIVFTLWFHNLHAVKVTGISSDSLDCGIQTRRPKPRPIEEKTQEQTILPGPTKATKTCP
jgi:hypothetical protein